MKCYSDIICKSAFSLLRNRSFFCRSVSHINLSSNLKFRNKHTNYISRAFYHDLSDNSDLLSRPFNDNVLKLTNYDEYHRHIYKPLDTDTVNLNDLVVSVFFNKQSTASLSVLDSVNELSSAFPSNKFLLVDSDMVPRSAYDADVQHFPSALLSYGGDLYRDLVSEESGFNPNLRSYYNWSFTHFEKENPENNACVLPMNFYNSVVKAIKKFSSYNGKKVSSIKSKAGTHSYTHGIDTDNLNLKRVGWPTERKTLNEKSVDTGSPRIIVIRRGIVNYEVKQLAHNLRLMLSPNCATRLKEGSKQKLRDFTSVADVLGLTHLIVLSQSSNGTYLKIANLPHGHTLTFLVNKLSLMSDVSNHLNNPHSFDSSNNPPLLILNGFGSSFYKSKTDDSDAENGYSNVDKAMGYVTDTLNKMIAPLDLTTTKIQNCKRAILFYKEKETNHIMLRHYSINLIDCNTSSQVKDLISRKSIKNLINKETDFENIVNTEHREDQDESGRSGFNSDTDEVVELDNMFPQNLIAKNKYGVELDPSEMGETTNKIGIRLVEIGPRLSLTLVKVQDDTFTGSVKYHKFVSKSQEELEENKKLEPTIINKRKLESERVLKIYQKYAKKSNKSNDGKLESKKDNDDNGDDHDGHVEEIEQV
ncbi:uncharacterized protein TOT_020000428 [Theileria orientalis strain Shintoku]|uniref:Brix domain-containing protein n=1 Tax=Theileria orientalis strain Shintoku TaxID=869250 RepID=J4C3B8_THEOR|nr:uncharacterized protein TOT_020000428 [Theileria orientalis strain Shintoku]BAM40166.1 uncharacterized protein TOT_020000428 [Theileria orientalis strain Shintoku]|eukprot:XP_009690467.1 uncharacterized protein TOT_020000428 [Theileria orientalis strain Shintoku]